MSEPLLLAKLSIRGRQHRIDELLSKGGADILGTCIVPPSASRHIPSRVFQQCDIQTQQVILNDT